MSLLFENLFFGIHPEAVAGFHGFFFRYEILNHCSADPVPDIHDPDISDSAVVAPDLERHAHFDAVFCADVVTAANAPDPTAVLNDDVVAAVSAL